MISVDLFAGAGGLTQGLKAAGFDTIAAVELDKIAAETFARNHPDTNVIAKDIKTVSGKELVGKRRRLHLLAGCPPCQGFSSIRRLNKSEPVSDERNMLIADYVRLVKETRPLVFMMENVPGLEYFPPFIAALEDLRCSGYQFIDYKVVNVKEYGVPQSRKRLVVIGSRLGPIRVAQPDRKISTVREAIGHLPIPEASLDLLHRLHSRHTARIDEMILRIPLNGGSRKDLPDNFILDCHRRDNIGFRDIYGRLSWDKPSNTITGGCLNPSKGRFLHPEQHRAITAREAALLQTFPIDYYFPVDAGLTRTALMIGNALPPLFSQIQAEVIADHIRKYNSISWFKNRK